MSTEAIRTAIRTAVEARRTSWSGAALGIEYDNLLLDLGAQSNAFLRVSTQFRDGWQVDLSANPIHRIMGNILLEGMVKVGKGTRAANEILDHFYPALHMTDRLTPIRTMGAKPLPPSKPVDGWLSIGMVIPFWYDATATGLDILPP
jgi:hypothetical protein